jgi:flagellar basal-body rod protein FlgB
MDATHIGLLDLAERRMSWADQRQTVLAQNIANANTPGYKSRDLRPFAAALAGAGGVTLVQTEPNHLAGTLAPASAAEVKDRTQAHAIDGNAVGLDEQLVKLSSTESTHELVTAIYRTYIGMFRTALGGGAT